MLWEKRADLTIKTSIKSYLFAAVRNRCLNFFDHQRVRGDHATWTKHSFKIEEDPMDNYDRELLQSKINESIEMLPEKCREVFKMSRFEEKSYKEIAEQLNISVKTVENQMGKALKHLRVELQDYLPVIIMLWSIGQSQILWGI